MNLPDPRSSNPAPTEPDRRQHPRYTAQVQIEIRQEGSDVPMRLETTDLSRGGCYIQLMMALPLGARVQVTLWLGGYPVVIQGRVVTRHPQFGNGIMFLDFEGEGDQLLRRYLETITTWQIAEE
jgi:PilZ domain